MNVLFVCSGNSRQGIAPFIRVQGDSLIRSGVDLDFFPVIGKGFSGYRKSVARLRKVLREKRYDLIHAHFVLCGWVAVLARPRMPLLLSLMGDDAYGSHVNKNQIKLSSLYLVMLSQFIQPLVKAVLVKSITMGNRVINKNKYVLIPNGVDLAEFKPLALSQARIKLGMKSGIKYVLFLGNQQDPNKNIRLLHDAMACLHANEIELLAPYPIEHGLIPVYLSAADALIFPSFMEGSPNVVKEAMACNCPIVATDVGDVRWVLGNTRGCYISSFDPHDVAEKIKLALAFGKRTNGRERILELGLDSETVAEKLVQVYKNIIAGNKAAG